MEKREQNKHGKERRRLPCHGRDLECFIVHKFAQSVRITGCLEGEIYRPIEVLRRPSNIRHGKKNGKRCQQETRYIDKIFPEALPVVEEREYVHRKYQR